MPTLEALGQRSGLLNLHERVLGLGGVLLIDGAARRATMMTWRIPLSRGAVN